MEQTEYPLVVEVFHTEMKNCVIEISALCGSLNFIISKGSSRGKNSMCFLHPIFYYTIDYIQQHSLILTMFQTWIKGSRLSKIVKNVNSISKVSSHVN